MKPKTGIQVALYHDGKLFPLNELVRELDGRGQWAGGRLRLAVPHDCPPGARAVLRFGSSATSGHVHDIDLPCGLAGRRAAVPYSMLRPTEPAL